MDFYYPSFSKFELEINIKNCDFVFKRFFSFFMRTTHMYSISVILYYFLLQHPNLDPYKIYRVYS